MVSISLRVTHVVLVACLLCFIDNFQRVQANRHDDPIMCVQCTPRDARCESGNNIEPRECEPRHRYCVQYRVFISESQGTFRGCSTQRLRGCRRVTIDKQESMVCYSTCTWDGCNGGSFTSSLLH